MTASFLPPERLHEIQTGLELLAGLTWLIFAFIEFKRGNKKALAECLIAGGFFAAFLIGLQLERLAPHDRIITAKKRREFVEFLTSSPKKPVWIVCDNTSGEGKRLTTQLRALLDEAGFSVHDKNGASRPGLVGPPTPNGILTPLTPLLDGNTDRDAFAVLLFCSRDVSNAPPHGIALCKAFEAARMKFGTISAEPNIIASGEVAVIVP